MGKKVSRTALRAEAKARVELFTAIGEFIFEFSQLEFTIRHLLGSALELTDPWFDIITAPYDFATLCRVTSAFICSLPDCDNELREHVVDTFNRCMALNDERVRIAHGTWMLGAGTRHVSRGTLKAASYFTTPTAIDTKTREIRKLMSAVVEILIGKRDEWPEIAKRVSKQI